MSIQDLKQADEMGATNLAAFTDTYLQLAKLPLAEYDRQRKTEAKRLGIRAGTLDAEVARRRETTTDANMQGQAVELADLELWPSPVDGAKVLAEIGETITKYVVLPGGAIDFLPLWVAHAHACTAFLHSPRLNIQSPEKRCGKTTLRDVLATLVPRPLATENLSTAVLFRLINKHQPTVLADEYDAWLHDNEELRGLLNAGHKRGARAYRCEGENNEVRGFNVFAPVVLAGIGNLPGTLHDRSIVVKLVRAKPGEVKAGFDSRRTQAETELCRKLARWCADNAKQIEASDPTLPGGAFNRLADNWRPLFAIAEIAGADWPQRLARAFALLTTQEDADANGIGAMLLADIQAAFKDAAADRMFSKSLVECLVAMSDRPWNEIRGKTQKPITENWLAHRLRGFGVSPKTLRIVSDRAKGYELRDLTEAFERYLPELSIRDSVTSPENTGSNLLSQVVTSDSTVTDANPREAPVNTELSRCHGSKTPALETADDELLV